MPYDHIIYTVENNVATVTLNRPDNLNAVTRVMMHEIMDALDRTDTDPEVRAVIFTGAGKAFCAGADLVSKQIFDVFGERGEDEPEDSEDPLRDLGGRLTLRLFASLKPLIAAVNGAAAGIGATMLLPMDYRLASETARFGFVFTRVGIVPEAASAWFLPRLVGIARALDWTLSGRIFSAKVALEGGLVSAIHTPGDLLAAAHGIAREIADNTAPVSVSLARQLMWQGLTFDHPMEAHRIDSRLMASRGAARDVQEGIGAFLEKRRPNFADRVPADLPPFAPWRKDPAFKHD